MAKIKRVARCARPASGFAPLNRPLKQAAAESDAVNVGDDDIEDTTVIASAATSSAKANNGKSSAITGTRSTATGAQSTAAQSVPGTDDELYTMSRILAHSFLPPADKVPNTLDAFKLLVEWAGADPATGEEWKPTWEDMVDVGAPYVAFYLHSLGTTGVAETIQEPRDGRTYVYADGIPKEHRLVPKPRWGRK